MIDLTQYTDEQLMDIQAANIEGELKARGYIYGWYKKIEYAGVIYILVNPAFPKLVKIGYTDDIEKRVKSFNRSSGLPDPYHVYAIYKVKKRLEDLKLHDLIDSLDSDLRHVQNREFYEMTPEKAFAILSAIAEINGDEDLLVKNPLNDSFFDSDTPTLASPIRSKSGRKPSFNFSILSIPHGAVLKFLEDESITAVVNGSDTVEFDGKTWKLSSLVRELKTRNGTANASGAYQGPAFWLYNGKTLTDIRKEKENDLL